MNNDDVKIYEFAQSIMVGTFNDNDLTIRFSVPSPHGEKHALSLLLESLHAGEPERYWDEMSERSMRDALLAGVDAGKPVPSACVPIFDESGGVAAVFQAVGKSDSSQIFDEDDVAILKAAAVQLFAFHHRRMLFPILKDYSSRLVDVGRLTAE